MVFSQDTFSIRRFSTLQLSYIPDYVIANIGLPCLADMLLRRQSLEILMLKGMNKILDSKKSKYTKVIEEKLVEKIK